MAPVRKNGDTVEISARAFTFITGLASALLLSVTIGGLSFYVGHAVLVDQVKRLNEFMGAGERNTAAQGERRDRHIDNLFRRQALDDEHRTEAGKWKDIIRKCERDTARLQSRTDHNKDDIREIRADLGQ